MEAQRLRDKLGLESMAKGIKNNKEKGEYINNVVKPYIAERKLQKDVSVSKRIE
jgi:hypothetical protein